MTVELTIGGYSPSMDLTNEHTVINAEYPNGRYTTDPVLALQWAEEFCAIANGSSNSPANDFEPRVWPRSNDIS